MKKSLIAFVLSLIILLTACTTKAPKSEYTSYSNSFFDTFNTLTTVVAYTKTQDEFNLYFEKIHNRFQQLHKLYDKYNSYEGINNIKTINDNAGVIPIKVEQEIIDLILFSKEWYQKTKETTNIALGPVLKVWSEYRDDGIYDPQNAKLPPMELLLNANKYTDLNKVIIDMENSTVYLEDAGMSLDVGAIAKGYATELVAQEIKQAGLTSAIISSGGNIRTIGRPLNGLYQRWGIGIHDPNSSIVSDNKNLDTVFITEASVVSSGDYQRYYVVGGQIVHHLINPHTLMPGDYFRAVTVVTPHSGLADLLSTALFLLPYHESRQLADSLEDVEAVWVMPNGDIEATEGMKKIMKSHGASNK